MKQMIVLEYEELFSVDMTLFWRQRTQRANRVCVSMCLFGLRCRPTQCVYRSVRSLKDNIRKRKIVLIQNCFYGLCQFNKVCQVG